MEKILVLGASGTVGAAVYQGLGRCPVFEVYGTYVDLLEEIVPDIIKNWSVIS